MRVVGVLVVAGWALLTAAGWLVALPLGLAIAGLGCLYMAKAVA